MDISKIDYLVMQKGLVKIYMKRRYTIVLIILLITMLTVGLLVGSNLKEARAESELVGFPENIQAFQQVYQLIHRYYVEDVDSSEVVEGAIKGMVQALDPYSYYMNKEEYEDFQVDVEGNYGGIGILVTYRSGMVVVVSPFKGTPGAEAGLEPGDTILGIDGVSMEDLSYKEAVDMMRGPEGTQVTLEVYREGVDSPLTFAITREIIEVPYVDEYQMTEENFGYINMIQFGKDVGKDIEKAINELETKGARGIILDLRNNPGGILQEAVDVASNFIDKGPIVYEKNREGIQQTYVANYLIDTTELPVVVLVNGGSASASEIVAGAIKDLDRGTVIGTRTFGKGTVQTVIPLPDGSALKLTIAHYYTAKGNNIHEIGLEPDIVIEDDPETTEDEQLLKAKEVLEQAIAGANPSAGGMEKAN